MAELRRRAPLDTCFDGIESVRRACAAFRDIFAELRSEVGKVIVGQEQIVHQALVALFAGGHILLEGVPGLGKTLLVRTLSQSLTLPFARIQFTPDLMPSDITGTSIVMGDPHTGRRVFTFKPGPIFHQLILADEINRATPKSQAALLEAMQEKSVTVGGETRRLDQPFFVMATQNPIEQEGTYPLPEAQLDRFLFKIIVPYAQRGEVNEILKRTTTRAAGEAKPVLDAQTILEAQQLAQRVIVAPHVQDYAVRLVLATHPQGEHMPESVRKYVRIGVSPRGAQALVGAARVQALIEGRYAVSYHDVQTIAVPALRHRILTSFEAEADGVNSDAVVNELIQSVPREGE